MKFRLLGIPVEFHWTFLIVAALLGASQRDPNAVLIWVAVVIVSVLVHEFGHALAARFFKQSPRILLHSFGGLTQFGGHGLGPRERQQPREPCAALHYFVQRNKMTISLALLRQCSVAACAGSLAAP